MDKNQPKTTTIESLFLGWKNSSKSMRSSSKINTFRSMSLTKPILKGIRKMNYQFPTPIQRKLIPGILTGRDVIAMSKTGSGKSAGFIIPMIEKLKSHSNIVGIRSMVVSPTRELAMQTDKFARSLSCDTNLKICRLIGGDSLQQQFTELSRNPDIVIGTPGRIVHILKEVKGLSLNAMEYLVFDEADRLFEMGFLNQLAVILSKCPANKQCVLISATLPKELVGFAQTGLKNPIVIRLNESEISSNLKMAFFIVKSNERISSLLYLIKKVISLKSNESTLIFVPTRYHVELLKMIFDTYQLKSSIIYGNMFSEARKINMRQFKNKETNYLIVTDVAARGIDIPFLNNVINFNFPSQPKLFVHRVGRAARAGKSGVAYSIITIDELPYFVDLRNFLGDDFSVKANPNDAEVENPYDNYYGKFPQSFIDEENNEVERILSRDFTIKNQYKMSGKAEEKYKETRNTPNYKSYESAKRMKYGHHPLFFHGLDKKKIEDVKTENEYKQKVSDYRPKATVFEVGEFKGTDSDLIMKRRRVEMAVTHQFRPSFSKNSMEEKRASNLGNLVENKRDEGFFINYQKPSFFVEKGYEISKENMFGNDLRDNIIDIQSGKNKREKGDSKMVWSKQKGKYVRVHFQKGEKLFRNNKVKRDGSVIVKNQNKMYTKWRKHTKGRIQSVGEVEKNFRLRTIEKDNNDQEEESGNNNNYNSSKKVNYNNNNEIKNEKQIIKNRKKKRSSKLHEKRAKMIKRNKVVKESLHFEAMARQKRKRDELVGKHGRKKFKRKR